MKPHHRQPDPVFVVALSLIAVFVLLTTPAVAQDQPAGTFGETVEVERIDVEVRVVDKSGASSPASPITWSSTSTNCTCRPTIAAS